MIKEAINFVVIAAIAFVMAYLFVEGWDQQHQIDLQKSATRVEQMISEAVGR
jgi:hypothetical protein